MIRISVCIYKMVLVSARIAAEYYHLSETTLRQKARKGEINVIKKDSGRYLYVIPEKNCSNTQTGDNFSQTEDQTNNKVIRKKIIYARVSSKKQVKDLYHQLSYLADKYPEYEPITDIASGINWDRRGFKHIITLLLRGEIKEVVVAYDDRFTRFGYEFFEWLFSQFNAKLTSIQTKKGNDTEDMLGDIMEIFTVFTARYHGSRRYKRNRKEDSVLPESETEEVI